MTRTEHAQRESDHQRWADDGGLVPEPQPREARPQASYVARSPWAAVGIAAAFGFALGWLTCRR